MRKGIQEWTKKLLWKTAFKKFEGIWSAKFFKGCLPQILLGPLLNTLSHILFGLSVHYISVLLSKMRKENAFVLNT